MGRRLYQGRRNDMDYVIGFLFYLVNYFIVAFFNTALIQCTRDYFNGETPSVKKDCSLHGAGSALFFPVGFCCDHRFWFKNITGESRNIRQDHHRNHRHCLEYRYIFCCADHCVWKTSTYPGFQTLPQIMKENGAKVLERISVSDY